MMHFGFSIETYTVNPDLSQTMNFLKPVFLILALVPLLSLSSCLTKRTVIENGRVVEEKNVIRRPVKEMIDNTEFE